MKKWNDESMIQVIELYAADNQMLASEQELSDLFDARIDEYDNYPTHDKTMLIEDFNIFADMLCKGGDIHPDQYYEYNYAGKYK